MAWADPLPGGKTLIMGIVNVTPDSFSDGGYFTDLEAALRQGRLLADDGADILDIGGESTRPGADPVSAEIEQARVLPVVAELARTLALPISIDTYKAVTARAALKAGARIVNDVWGLHRDPEMAFVIAEAGADAVLMHNRERADPAIDIVADALRFFETSLAMAERAGIADRAIALDPGIGFGKTREQNLDILRRLPELAALGRPILVGASRKSFLKKHYGEGVPARDRLAGTLAAHLYAAGRGAAIVRVHDVRAHVEALAVFNEMSGQGA